MGKEKEKQTEKGRDVSMQRQSRQGQGEKNEMARKEGNTTTTVSEQFFKVFLPEKSAERLKIPPLFQEYVGEAPNRVVSLKGPSGNTWNVVLTSGSQGLCFTRGWKEFAHDHSLMSGHFLVFTYDGHSEFSVAVFSASGIKDKATLKVQPRNEPAIKLEEEEEDVVYVDVADTPEASADLPSEGGRRSTRKRTSQMDDVMESGTTPKRHSRVQKKTESTTGSSNNTAPSVCSNKDYSCMLDELSSRNKIRIRSKDVPRVGKFVSKKIRLPAVISQRRLVTEEEKNNAIDRGNEFKSKQPFAMQVMMESYVYVGFFMNIQYEFVKKLQLPQSNKKITLWDPQGKSWQVNYIYYNDRVGAAFSGGWGKFATGNNLEEFDVCVFELFKEDNFKVHIYRVVPEITPLLRRSGI